MKGKLENLTVKQYNDDIIDIKNFDYLSNHNLQGRCIIVAPFFAELETDNGLLLPDLEDYTDEETYKKKTRAKDEKAIVDKAVVVKISEALKTHLSNNPDDGYSFKEGDVILFETKGRMPSEYKADRTTLSYEKEDHFLLKLNLHEIETVITK